MILRWLIVACVAVLLATASASCGQSSSPKTSSTSCSNGAEQLNPVHAPLVQLQSGAEAAGAVTTGPVNVPCHSWIAVSTGGDAELRQGSVAICDLTQVPATLDRSAKPARLQTHPNGTVLARISNGSLSCTITSNGQKRKVQLCDDALLTVDTGTAAARVTCDPDPVFAVLVVSGTVTVRDPSGTVRTVQAGQQLGFDYGMSRSQVSAAAPSSADCALFDTQSSSLDQVAPPSTTSTGTGTTTSTAGCGNTSTTPTTTTAPTDTGSTETTGPTETGPQETPPPTQTPPTNPGFAPPTYVAPGPPITH